jgi:hypothetical protein
MTTHAQLRTIADRPAARRDERREPVSAGSFALVGTLLAAGIIHLVLVPEHLTESLALGLGFLGSGLAQVGLAAVLVRIRSTRLLQLALGISVLSLAALTLAVTIGLPVVAHGETMGAFGPVEELDDLAALTGLIELISLVLSLRFLRRDGRETR